MKSGRNPALNNAGLHLGELVGAGLIERNEVENALMAASRANGYITKDGYGAAWATLQSGLKAGMKVAIAASFASNPTHRS